MWGQQIARALGSWRAEFSETLTTKTVYIIPDNDAPGNLRASEIFTGVLSYAASVSIVELTSNAVKDITDWFNAGHSESELISILEGGNV